MKGLLTGTLHSLLKSRACSEIVFMSMVDSSDNSQYKASRSDNRLVINTNRPRMHDFHIGKESRSESFH